MSIGSALDILLDRKLVVVGGRILYCRRPAFTAPRSRNSFRFWNAALVSFLGSISPSV